MTPDPRPIPEPSPSAGDPVAGLGVSAPASGPTAPAGLRVQARVALALLESIRAGDRPEEVMDEENVTVTIPRRLGLSGVVDSQIRRYEEEVRRRRRVPEAEVRDLMRLMARRPDAGALFHQVGRSLEADESAPLLVRALPVRAAASLARKRVSRRLRDLFGGDFVRPVGKPFEVVAVQGMLTEAVPDGDACGLITGFCQNVVERSRVGAGRVHHSACRALGEAECRWTFIPSEE